MKDLNCAICSSNFTIGEQKEYRLSSEPVCPSCAVHLRGYIDYNGKREKYIHKCQFCGSTMENNSPKPEVYTCDTCYRDRFVSQNHEIYKMLIQRDDCEIKGDILMFPLSITRENDNRTRKFAEKTCLNCHRSFLPQGSKQYFCLCCYKIATCKQCGKEFAGRCAGDAQTPENVFCSKSCSCQHQMDHRTLYEHSSNTYEYDMIGTLEEYLVEITKECPVNDDTVFYYSKVKGIWIKYDEDTSEVLDVMYTTNVEKEYNWIQNALKYNESDKYKALRRHKNITYYYVSSFTSELEGLMREMSFALNYKARYWSPSPGIQSHIMSKLRKEGKIYEETIRDQLG